MKKMWRGLMTGILGTSMLLGSLGSVSAATVPKDIWLPLGARSAAGMAR